MAGLSSTSTVAEFITQYGDEGYETVMDHLENVLALYGKLDRADRALTTMRARKKAGLGSKSSGMEYTAEEFAAKEKEVLNAKKKILAEERKFNEEVKRAAYERMPIDSPYLGVTPKEINEAYKINDKINKQQRKHFNDIQKASGQAQKSIIQSMTPDEKVIMQWNRLGQVFRRVTDALISFVILNTISRMVTGFFGSLIESNAQLEVMEMRLRNVNRGDGSFDRLRAHIVALTVTTPFIIKDFIDAAVQVTAFGISAQKALFPIANWAVAIGRDLGDIATAYSKIIAGSPRTALLLTTRGISKAEFDKELRETMDRQQALDNIILRHYGDIARKTSETFQGMVTNIKDAWFMIASVMGSPVFENMRKDVERFYRAMIGQTKEASGWVRILGEVLGGIYSVIKMLLPYVATELIFRGMTKAAEYASGVFIQFEKHLGAGLAGALKLAAIGSSTLIFIIQRIGDFQEALNELTVTLNDMNKAEEWYGRVSVQFVDMVGYRIKAIQEYMSWWNRMVARPISKIYTADFWTKGGFLWAAVEIAREDEALKSEMETLKKNKAALEDLVAARERFNKSLDNSRTILDDLQDAEKIGKDQNLVNSLKDMLAVLEKARAANFVNFTKIGRGGDGSVAGYDALTMNNYYKNAITSLRRILSGPAELRKEGLKELREKIKKDMAANIGKTGDIGPWIDELLGLQDKHAEKTKATTVNLKDEIAAALAKQRELVLGESALWADMQAHMAQEASLREQLGVMREDDQGRDKVYLDFINAQNTVLMDQAKLKDRMDAAVLRRQEAERGVESALYNLEKKRIELEYERTGDLSVQAIDREKELLELQRREISLGTEIARQRQRVSEETGKDQSIREVALAQLAELEQRRVDVVAKQYDLMKEILNATSRDLGSAFGKSLRKMTQDLNTFFDDIAEMTLGGTRELGAGLLHDAIFGNADRAQADKQIADARLQLQQLYQERNNANNAANQVSRRYMETNEQYAQRMQMMEAAKAGAFDQYTYQTKELELLQQINQLERERNSIIADRLKQLGEKVIDKMLDQLVGQGLSMLGGLFGGGGNNLYGSSLLDIPVTVKPPPVPPKTYSVIFNGPVYGMEDFKSKVDETVKQIERSRGR